MNGVGGYGTERLRLRRWKAADRAPFAAMNADPEVMRHFPAPLDRAASDALVDRIEAHLDRHGFGLWALERRDSGDFIGFTGLNPLPDGVGDPGGYEVGWRLARRAWKHGYATEAATRVLEAARTDLGMRAVWSLTATLNQPSIAVMRRIGLHEVDRFEHPRVPEGHPLQPHVLYRTPDRWALG